MIVRGVALAAVMLLAPVNGAATGDPPAPASETLHLQCDGVSEYESDSTGLAFGGGGGVASLVGAGAGHSQDQVLVEIKDGVARVKLPAHLLNWAHNKEADSWKTLSKFRMTDAEITGGYHIDLLENPSVRIDRITGHISIHANAPYDFSGECKAYDPSTAVRKF